MQTTNRVKNPRKQRKKLFNAPAHLRHKLMAAHVAPDLVASKGAKTLPVRKGDTVRIMRGDHQGFEGKVSRIDLKNFRVYLEGLTREKVDGTTIFVPVHPSKVMIRNLSLDDKWRKGIVERKKKLVKEEKVVRKPRETAAKAKEEKTIEAKVTVEKKSKKKPEVAAKTVEKKPAAKRKKAEEPKQEEKSAEKKVKKAPKKSPAGKKSTPEKEGGT